MSQTIRTYNTLVRSVDDNLNIVKRCGASYDTILHKIRPLIDKFTNQLYHYSQQKTELVQQKETMDVFMVKAKAAKKVREEKIHKLNESIVQYSNAAKTVLSSMRFKGLRKVKKEPNVEKLYLFFFVNLYYELADGFKFEDFCNIALGKDIDDFQKRLAKFSIYDLSLESRERFFELKNADYSLNKNNDEFNYLLEWLDYNFEAYVLLKERNSEEKIIKETMKKEGIKVVQSEAADKMLEEINSLVNYLEENLQHLRLYEKRLVEALNLHERNTKFAEINRKTQSLFKDVDTFKGNDVVNSLNQRFQTG